MNSTIFSKIIFPRPLVFQQSNVIQNTTAHCATIPTPPHSVLRTGSNLPSTFDVLKPVRVNLDVGLINLPARLLPDANTIHLLPPFITELETGNTKLMLKFMIHQLKNRYKAALKKHPSNLKGAGEADYWGLMLSDTGKDFLQLFYGKEKRFKLKNCFEKSNFKQQWVEGFMKGHEAHKIQLKLAKEQSSASLGNRVMPLQLLDMQQITTTSFLHQLMKQVKPTFHNEAEGIAFRWEASPVGRNVFDISAWVDRNSHSFNPFKIKLLGRQLLAITAALYQQTLGERVLKSNCNRQIFTELIPPLLPEIVYKPEKPEQWVGSNIIDLNV